MLRCYARPYVIPRCASQQLGGECLSWVDNGSYQRARSRSAVPQSPNVSCARRHVVFVQRADISKPCLLNDLISPQHQSGADLVPNCFSSIEIADQLETGWLLNRNVSRLMPRSTFATIRASWRKTSATRGP